MSITLDKKINFWTKDLSIIVDVPNFNAGEFARWLRERREAIVPKLTITALADNADLSKQYISLLEKGDDHLLTNKPVQPSLDKVERIAKALGADINEAREKAGYERFEVESNVPKPILDSIARSGTLNEQDSIFIASVIDGLEKRNKGEN